MRNPLKNANMHNYPPGFNERELDEKEDNGKLGVAGERKGFKFKNHEKKESKVKEKKEHMAKKFKHKIFGDSYFTKVVK